MRDEINIYKKTFILKNECPSCFKINHQIQNCPLLNLLPKYEKVALKYIANKNQKRDLFVRRRKKKNSLKIFENFKKSDPKIVQRELRYFHSFYLIKKSL